MKKKKKKRKKEKKEPTTRTNQTARKQPRYRSQGPQSKAARTHASKQVDDQTNPQKKTQGGMGRGQREGGEERETNSHSSNIFNYTGASSTPTLTPTPAGRQKGSVCARVSLCLSVPVCVCVCPRLLCARTECFACRADAAMNVLVLHQLRKHSVRRSVAHSLQVNE